MSLYCRVYGTNKIPNNKILLQFARGLVKQFVGANIDWATFTRHLEVRQLKLKATKVANGASVVDIEVCGYSVRWY